MTPPRVSIVIPTRNGMATLPELFDALGAQQAPYAWEVVAIDSGSTDGTIEFLRGRADRMLTVPPLRFDHGLTRNAAVAEARGEFVVLLVQDAVPAGPAWLTALVGPLEGDPQLAGTFARQRPRTDAGAIARRQLAGWVAGGDAPRTVSLDREAFDALHPLERLDRCAFDHVCAAVRRSVWLQHPYRPTAIAEDIEWAREVLLAGYRLAYIPSAVVVHSHDRSARYEYRRTYVLHYRLHELFGVRTIPSRRALGRAIAATIRDHLAWRQASGAPVDRGLPGIGRAVALGIALPWAQYRGAADAACGRPVRRAEGV